MISNISFAQEYSLESYINTVKQNNYDLKQSENQIKIASQETRIAKSVIIPNIAIDGFYQRDFNKNFLFINDFKWYSNTITH